MLHAVRVIAITDPARELDFAKAVAGCPAGSVLFQIRGKQLDGGPLLSIARAAPAPIAVNDRLDVALAVNAAMLHVPEDGLPLADARTLWSGLIGVSRHTVDAAGAAAADKVDLVQLGPVFLTPSKPDVTPLGMEALTMAAVAIARHASKTRRTLLAAVGGIDTPERAHAAALAGADVVSLIRAAWTGASLLPFVQAVDDGHAARSP